MPLVRFEVRNEYGLGQGELYREGNREEDSKAVLDGVAVAGLVGILRQLGDLAEFVLPPPPPPLHLQFLFLSFFLI